MFSKARLFLLLLIALTFVGKIIHEIYYDDFYVNAQIPKQHFEIKKQVDHISANLLKLNNSYLQASGNQKNTLENQMIVLSVQRKRLLDSLISESADLAITSTFPPKIFTQLPPSVRENIEHEVSIEGTLFAGHYDDFKNKIATNFYNLNTSSETYYLYIANQNFQEQAAPSGSCLKIKGYKIGTNLIIDKTAKDTFIILEPKTNQKNIKGASTIKYVAYVLVKPGNESVGPFTHDDLRKRAFTDIDSVANFYREVSYGNIVQSGKLRTDGDIFGWFTIPNSLPCPNDFEKVRLANVAAQNAGVDLSGYDNIVYIFYIAPTSVCSGGTWGYGSGNVSFISMDGTQNTSNFLLSSLPYSVEHEMGHNYGEHHSNFYYCKDANGKFLSIDVSTNCTSYEYADSFDIMGNSDYTHHFNGYHKGRLGYLTTGEPNTIDVPNANGTFTYDIAPIEQNSSAPQVVRVPRDIDATGNITDYYYLEFRQPIGYFDTHKYIYDPTPAPIRTDMPVFNGITIRLNPPYSTFRQSWLITTHPSTLMAGAPYFYASPLAVGENFHDPIANISVSALSISSSSAKVRIVKGTTPCTLVPPSIVVSPQSQYGQRGEILNYDITLTNNNTGCSNSEYTLKTDKTGQISILNPITSVNLAPGSSKTISLQLYSWMFTTTPLGAVEFTVTISDTNYPSYYNSAKGIYIIYENTPNDTIPPISIITNPQNGAVVSKTLTITANGGDYVGTTKVEILKDNNLIFSTNYSYNPFKGSFSPNYSWDTTKEQNGVHTLVSKFYDATGNVGISAPVSITLSNQTITPTATSRPQPMPGDATGDGKVDGVDNIIWLNHFNQNVSGTGNGDFNNDGNVNGADYVIWLTNYNS